ncbi:MAG TPA: YihY family inner membrane protein, partial [Cellvibrionaceae bacterium]
MQTAGLKQHIRRTRLSWIMDLCVQFYRDYHASGCQDQAAALTYMTLFALVPLMTVSYAVFSMVPEFAGVASQVEKFLFSHFVPESSAVIQSYLSSFYQQAQKLTWIGVVFLGITAFLMLGDIERTFNRIWGVRRGRRGLNKYLLYWAVLSIGPLLIGSAFVISTYVVSSKYWMWGGSVIWSPFVAVFPLILTATAFSLLFITVPNCSVPIKYGVIGGVSAALGFELLKFFFGLAVTNANFQFIYGAFAALPLFLLWLNFLWMTVLLGALLVRILAEKRYLLVPERYNDFASAIICLSLLREGQLMGKPVNELAFVSAGVNQLHWQQLREKWMKAGWVTETQSATF